VLSIRLELEVPDSSLEAANDHRHTAPHPQTLHRYQLLNVSAPIVWFWQRLVEILISSTRRASTQPIGALASDVASIFARLHEAVLSRREEN
jgi:hypothetical protein